MKNKIVDLNNHLFAQLERLSEENISPEQLEQEVKRSRAMNNIAKNIINASRVTVDAMKLMERTGVDVSRLKSRELLLGQYKDND